MEPSSEENKDNLFKLVYSRTILKRLHTPCNHFVYLPKIRAENNPTQNYLNYVLGTQNNWKRDVPF